MKDQKKSVSALANNSGQYPGQHPAHGLLDSIESEVAPEVSPLLRIIVSHGRKIALVFIIMALALAATGLYRNYSGGKKSDLQKDLGMMLIEKDPKVRLDSLEAFLAKAPSDFKSPVLLAIAQSAFDAKDYAKEAGAWGEFIKISEGPIKVMGTFGQANAMAWHGKDAEAIAILEGLLGDKNAPVRFTALLRLAVLYEGSGQNEKAIATFERIVADKDIPADKAVYQQKISYLKQKVDASGK